MTDEEYFEMERQAHQRRLFAMSETAENAINFYKWVFIIGGIFVVLFFAIVIGAAILAAA